MYMRTDEAMQAARVVKNSTAAYVYNLSYTSNASSKYCTT